MIRTYRSLSVTLGAAAAVLAGAAWQGQDPAQPKPPSQEQVRRLLESMSPGPEHAMLAMLAGEWDQTLKMWGPGRKQPMTAKASGGSKMILGGRFLESRSTWKMALMPGMPAKHTESLSITGFDRRSGEFTQTGYDTMGTYSVSAKGKLDPATSTITMSGEDYDPIFEVTVKYDFVLKIVSDDELVHSVIFHGPPHAAPGESFKMVEVTSKRKKG